MLLRLAYLGLTNTFALLRLLPMNDRNELLDRSLIWNQRHLLHALCEYERFYNSHRPHQGVANADHHNPCQIRSPIQPRSVNSTSVDTYGRAASSTNTTTPPDLHG